MISDNISWIVTYPGPHTWWPLRDKALQAKIALGGAAEQAMPTDLAQRHEVVTRTRSMHGRSQLLDQAARPLRLRNASQ